MSHALPHLTYEIADLNPWISQLSLEHHYHIIHPDYLRRLNKALEPFPQWAGVSIEELLHAIASVPPEIQQAVRDYGGGHANHTLFWMTMAPEPWTGPTGELAGAITTTFGGFAEFQERFTLASLNHFGSGWAWLAVNRYGDLEIETTRNEENPLMHGHKPILGLDLWEHAYYLQYGNRRQEYIAAWWHVVNWPYVERGFAGRRWFADPRAVTS